MSSVETTDETKRIAQRVVDRVDFNQLAGNGPAVGLDPVTIFMVLCSIIGLLMQCWTFIHKEVSQAELHARLVVECEDPRRKDRLIRRAARQFRRKSETPLTIEQSMILAKASIEEALAAEPEELVKYAAACGAPSGADQFYLVNEEQCDEV